jgi:DNA-binding transcriptional ArsR family regulator
MTMRLLLGDAGVDLVAFGSSPADEALRSLRVLTDVKHHPLHISWALRTRSRTSPELKDEINAFAFWYLDRPLVFRDIWPAANVWSWADELSMLRKAVIADFAEPLIHAALTHNGRGPRIPLQVFLDTGELQEQALAQIEARHPASLPVMRELIADPERCRDHFAEFLATYWEACIAPDWPNLEARLLADITRRGQAMSWRGLPRMLEELSPHVRIDPNPDRGVVIRRPGSRRDPIEVTLTRHDEILLLPSHFVWPELTAVIQRRPQGGRVRLTVLIAYALAEMQQQGQAPVPPEDLLRLLRSAGDPTRLQILQLLARKPRSTREIAGLIGLTEAAISKHLRLLHEAGWVETERRSYYSYYHLIRDSSGRLTRALEHMLESPRSEELPMHGSGARYPQTPTGHGGAPPADDALPDRM